jgi:hypothetical protein
MRTKLLKTILAIVFLSLPAVSYGQIITIGIEAVVNNVTDADNLLEGKITAGSIITGTYTYDTSTPDTNPATETGMYIHYSLPYGMALTVGGIIFKSAPQNTMFTIGITNASPGQMFSDSYGIRSYNNVPVLDGIQVDEFSWALEDYTNTAVSSTVLPTIAPVLSDWSYNILYIGGGVGGTSPCYEKEFYIEAEVTSAVLVPEPMSLILFGFGLLALRKRKQ